MPVVKSVSSPVPLISQAHLYRVTECPKCRSPKVTGPHDTHHMANGTFTRTYACLACWWYRELAMIDDVALAEKKHARAEAKKLKAREQARRT